MITFDQSDLVPAVEALSPRELDALPFGVIRVNGAGVITVYNATERRLSGYDRPAIGEALFSQVAPCMDNAGFRGQLEKAFAAGEADIELLHVGDFSDPARTIRIRVVSAPGGGWWQFHQRG